MSRALSWLVVPEVWLPQVSPSTVAPRAPAAPAVQQLVALRQVMPSRLSARASDCSVQVEPPLVVAMISPALPITVPAAKQVVVLTQLIESSATVAAVGAVSLVQVEPPLVVAMISGWPETTAPTAQQTVVLTHEIALSA